MLPHPQLEEEDPSLLLPAIVDSYGRRDIRQNDLFNAALDDLGDDTSFYPPTVSLRPLQLLHVLIRRPSCRDPPDRSFRLRTAIPLHGMDFCQIPVLLPRR